MHKCHHAESRRTRNSARSKHERHKQSPHFDSGCGRKNGTRSSKKLTTQISVKVDFFSPFADLGFFEPYIVMLNIAGLKHKCNAALLSCCKVCSGHVESTMFATFWKPKAYRPRCLFCPGALAPFAQVSSVSGLAGGCHEIVPCEFQTRSW